MLFRSHSYTDTLLKNENELNAKLMEEAEELTQTATRNETIWEAADLFYFMMVTLESKGCTWQEVLYELQGRQKQ